MPCPELPYHPEILSLDLTGNHAECVWGCTLTSTVQWVNILPAQLLSWHDNTSSSKMSSEAGSIQSTHKITPMHYAMVQNAEEWKVMCKMLKHHAQSIDFVPKTSCSKYDAMLEMQKYSCFLKCRNIHTCSSSELENMLIIHRAQDNRQFPINFVLCCTTLKWRASNITKPCNNWSRGLQFTALEHPSRSCRGHQWCHATCLVPRASIDHVTSWVLHYTCFLPWRSPQQILAKYQAVFSVRLIHQLNDFSRNGLHIHLLH